MIIFSVLVSLLSISVLILTLHIISIFSVGGYKRYFKYLKLLSILKNIDCSVISNRVISYSMNGTTYTHSVNLNEIYNFNFVNSHYFIYNTFSESIGNTYTSSGMSVCEQILDQQTGSYKKESHYIPSVPDLLLFFRYRKVFKKCKRLDLDGKSLTVNNEEEMLSLLNKQRKRKFRSRNLNKILED